MGSVWGLQRYALLASIFFLIIGTFWLLGSLQEPIFFHIVGASYYPLANILSFVILLPLMLFYLTALARYGLCTVFVFFTLAYAVFFFCMGLLLLHPTIGLANAVPASERVLGWFFYLVARNYGTFLVTLFWSFATSVTSVGDAKMVFPFLSALAQIGSIAGSTLAKQSDLLGVPALVMASAGAMVLLAGLFHLAHQYYAPQRQLDVTTDWRDMFVGLQLLWQRPYLRRVFVISTAHLVVGALFDYQMNLRAHECHPSIEQFAWFKGLYGQLLNSFTLCVSLGGTQFLLGAIGVWGCLLLYPLITAGAVSIMVLWPTLWVLAGGVVVIRGLSFVFNNPTKEILYIPESDDVRFKVKSWIDMIGYRFAWVCGSALTEFCQTAGSVVWGALSLGALAVWFPCAWSVGQQFEKKSKKHSG